MKGFFTLFLLLTSCLNLFATWSIILIDPVTNEIGIAGASCTPNCYGIGEIAPGKGAIIVQAMSNNEARSCGLKMIISGSTPAQIIAALRHEKFDSERQQYAVVTLKEFNMPQTYSGLQTHDYKAALTGDGFSVQGNTLPGEIVIQAMYDAVLRGREQSLSIDQILMRALEAGAIAGGDKRCGEQKATSAFITVAKAEDKKPYLNLMIFNQKKGGQNAVAMLTEKHKRWRSKQVGK